MICREPLWKSVQAVHRALLCYSNCLCEDLSPEEQKQIHRSIEELSKQLSELRTYCQSVFGKEPFQ